MPATYGVNPYAALPLTVRQDPAYHFSNWHHLPSPYGPLLTLLTEGLAPLSLPDRVLGLEGRCCWPRRSGTLALVALAARRLGRSPQAAVALVGLNPLVLVYGIGGAHNEPLVLLCGVAAVALAIVGWEAGTAAWWDVGAGACAVLAAGFKPSAALLAPIVVLACRRRLPALGGAGGAGALSLAVVGLVYGGHLPGDRHPGRARRAAERAQRARRARRPRWDDGRTIAPSPTSCWRWPPWARPRPWPGGAHGCRARRASSCSPPS